MTDAEHIELAKEIAAAKRGEAGMPYEDWKVANIARLRAAVDSIRTRRQDWRAPEKAPRKTKTQSGEVSAPAKAAVSQMSLDDFLPGL